MGATASPSAKGKVVSRDDFGSLIAALRDAGYTVLGPTVRDAAITYAEVHSDTDLPIGWTDRQTNGSYSLERRSDDALFGYVVGQSTWKRFLYPPQSVLLEIGRSADGALHFSEPAIEETSLAFLGVRGCELAAIAIQDTVFLESGYIDRTYATRRRNLFTVAVNCAVVGGSCFCTSMGTGPRCSDGYDLALTEVIDGERHEFIFEAGSEAGARILDAVPGRPAGDSDHTTVAAILAQSAASMQKVLDTDGLKELLESNRDHHRWDDAASRCLACTNCTLVCPTCFCSTTEDTASLDGTSATRLRRWDSCFALDFSSLHGSPVRASTKSRYRQWMTHKLSGWHDQFGISGCVGCGRCITWCPVGIDITEEAAAIRSEAEVPI